MMKRLVYFLICLALTSSVMGQTVLQLRTSVQVTSADVVLGDLVEEKSRLPEEWATRRVMSSPPAGEVTYHALTTIAYSLQRYSDMKRVTLRGEPVIAVQRKDRKLELDEMENPIMGFLKEDDAWRGMDLDVRVLSLPRNSRVPVGITTYRVNQIDQKTAKGYSLAHVTVVVDGLDVKEIPVGVEIQSLTKVWVIRENLPRGHVIDSEKDLRSEQRVVDAMENYVLSSEDLSGYELNRNLTAGSLLVRNSVSKPLCAKRGEWVAINAFGKGLHITLRAKAMANGRLGERIMCVNERSQRKVLVELTGTGNGKLVRL